MKHPLKDFSESVKKYLVTQLFYIQNIYQCKWKDVFALSGAFFAAFYCCN
jgi:hypothetical protein